MRGSVCQKAKERGAAMVGSVGRRAEDRGNKLVHEEQNRMVDEEETVAVAQAATARFVLVCEAS